MSIKSVLDKWAVARAKKVETREKALQEERDKLYKASALIAKENANTVRTIINEKLDDIATILNAQPCHLKEGDKVVLNKYELVRNNANGWDGGAPLLINNLTHDNKNQITAPVTGIVNKIYVDRSQTDELIDRFIADKYSLIGQFINGKTVWQNYTTWATNQRLILDSGKYYGLFKSATFTLDNTDFKPSWGINIGTFLLLSSKSGQATLELWQQEIDLRDAQRRLEELSKKLNNSIYGAKTMKYPECE